MKLNPIIVSLLETDMYKFSMGQAIYHQFSDYKTTWTFKCRNKDVHFTEEMVEEIREQIKHFCTLRFTEDELDYLENVKWMKGSYVDFLRLWQARYADFKITTDADKCLFETVGDKRIYTVIDKNGNRYVFRENSIMNYKVNFYLNDEESES